MKTQLIKIRGNQNIIVSDEEIKEYCLVFYQNLVFHAHYSDGIDVTIKGHNRNGQIVHKTVPAKNCQKLIASNNPDHNLPSINWNGLERKCNIIDIDQIALEEYPVQKEWFYEIEHIDVKEKERLAFIKGFFKIQSLENQKFDFDEVVDICNYLRNTQMRFDSGHYGKPTGVLIEKWMKDRKPEVFDIKIEMLSDDLYDPRSKTGLFKKGDEDAPRIRNNKIKIVHIER